MKQLIIVAASGIAVAALLLTHRYGGALAVGVGVGTLYFLKAVVRGGGIAEVRITRSVGEPRKPADPAGAIGMGLAASGIAAGAMGSPEEMLALGAFLPVAAALGLLIALGYAIMAYMRERNPGIGQSAALTADNGRDAHESVPSDTQPSR